MTAIAPDSSPKQATLAKIKAKIRAGQTLTAQENLLYNRSLRGQDFSNFSSSRSSPFRSGSPLESVRGTGIPVNTPGNSLASWPATSINNKPGNSLASWPATTATNTPGNSLASWPATQYNSPNFGYNDRDRGSDPMRQAVTLPGLIGANDRDRGSDPMRIPPPAPAKPKAGGGGDQAPSGIPTGGSDTPFITHMPDEQFPDIPNVTLSWHDFTDEAKKKVAGAYAPLYEAISQGKTNATRQSTRSQAITKGMYDQLAASDTAANAAAAKRYDDAMRATAGSDAELQNTIANSGAAANSDLASTMAAAGLGNGRSGTAAADILSEQIGRDSAAGLAAKTQASANQTELSAQKLSQGDYGDAMVSADRQSGRAAREDLINQLGQVLQQYDQQQLETKGNEAQQALSLNQQMGQNDWTAQTGSADQTWNAYNAAMGQTQAKIGLDETNVGLQNQAAQREIDAQAAAAAAARHNYEFERTAGQADIREADNVAHQQAVLQHQAKVDAAELAYKNAKTPIEQAQAQAALIRAQADLTRAQNTAPTTQGTNPNAPGYDPMKDSTSPEYQAAHNPAILWRQATKGITKAASGGNVQENERRADALGAYVESEYQKATAGIPSLPGVPKGSIPLPYFKTWLIQYANGRFTPIELNAAAEAYQQYNSGPATVIPGR